MIPLRPAIHSVFARSVCCFLMALFALLLSGVAFGDVTGKPGDKKKSKTKEADVIVEVTPTSAKFVAGLSVDVELTAAVPSLKQVTFIIREGPQHGTLSAIKPHPRDNNKVVVTYTHRDLNELNDRFTYACRFGEGPVSAPAIVTLTGERKEAKLVVQASPRMDKVYLGGETSAHVKVKNAGLAEFSSSVSWPAPWSGPPHLSLKIGEEQEFLLTFKPVTIGAFRLENELQPGVESSKVMAYGECARSLTISPGSLVLAHDKKTGARSGTLTIANARPEVIKVAVTLPPRLKGVTEEIDMSANTRQDFVFWLPSEDVTEFKEEVQISAEGQTYRVVVLAEPKPGYVTVITPSAPHELDLGRLEINAEVTGKIVVRNSGGRTLVLETRVAPPFYLDTQGRAFRIEPGQTKELVVTAKADRFGSLSGELVIEGGDARTSVLLSALVNADSTTAMTGPLHKPSGLERSGPYTSNPPQTHPEASPKESALSSGHASAVAAVSAYLASNGLPVPREMINPFLEKVERVEMTDQTSSSVTLAWAKPKVLPVGWRLEIGTQVFEPVSKLTVKVWTALNNWKLVNVNGDRVGVRIHGLKPATQFEMRIMGVDRDGKFSEPSPVCLVTTAAAWRMPSWVWRTLIVIGLSLAFYVLYRYRRGDFEF